ncbi:MAG: Unknown protein [uncultured Sulfurovum sp.]|uniref:Caspase family p20 domain-containing protein n=1 Tax=uncultured Sulfurovum sp. TaxID=269237 RepID=A0A6S6T7L1_9BACT|nr:MAG: Unknown protein [uncultured Sulfurovum sp.]
MLKFFIFFYVLFIFACTAQPSLEERPMKRVALVVGNQDYKDNVLDNPIHDAKGIAKTLTSIGFDVHLTLNSTEAQFNQALQNVKSKIEPNNTLLFIYFAGHGNTLKEDSNEQFLMMTDKNETVLISIYKLYDFLNKAKARHNVMMIDACRDYKEHYVPVGKGKKNYRGNFRGVSVRSSDGFKKEEAVRVVDNYAHEFPKSTLISYATDPAQKAKDWSEHDMRHSPYSYALIQHLADEEVPIGEVFRRVRESVLNETNRTQGNSEITKLEKNIWLVPKRAEVAFAPPL